MEEYILNIVYSQGSSLGLLHVFRGHAGSLTSTTWEAHIYLYLSSVYLSISVYYHLFYLNFFLIKDMFHWWCGEIILGGTSTQHQITLNRVRKLLFSKIFFFFVCENI